MKLKVSKILILLFGIAFTIFAYLKLTYFFEIDSCLDQGGRWNNKKNVCELSSGIIQFDTTVLSDKRFASGHEYETRNPIKPRTFHFENYTFVTGFPNDSGAASLGLYYSNKEIFFEITADGFYDTIMTANLNNDDIPDFLVSFAFEDGASLYGLISISKNKFLYKKLINELHQTYCDVGADSLSYILPLQIRDINNDGKDEIILNLLKINNKTFGISCTDTISNLSGADI